MIEPIIQWTFVAVVLFLAGLWIYGFHKALDSTPPEGNQRYR